MKRLPILLAALCLAILFAGLAADEAQARRLGGGSSFGMQRQPAAPRPTPYRQATPAAPTPAAPASTPVPRRSWLGPIAGLAAGLGLGALLGPSALGSALSGLLMLGLLAAAAVIVLRLLRPGAATDSTDRTLRFVGPGRSPDTESIPANIPAAGWGKLPDATPLPPDFDTDAFLRLARSDFLRLQSAIDACNLDDARAFVAPALFTGIKSQVAERRGATRHAEVVTLAAELLGVASEGGRHVASVRFSGLMHKSDEAAEREVTPQPFDELWQFVEPENGSRGWTVADVRQAGSGPC